MFPRTISPGQSLGAKSSPIPVRSRPSQIGTSHRGVTPASHNRLDSAQAGLNNGSLGSSPARCSRPSRPNQHENPASSIGVNRPVPSQRQSNDSSKRATAVSSSSKEAATYMTRFEELRRQNLHALRLLSLMSLLHCDDIPKTFLLPFCETTNNPNAPKQKQLEASLNFLLASSLISKGKKVDSVTMHQSVQMTMQRWLEEKQRLKDREICDWLTKTLPVLTDQFPRPSQESQFGKWRRYLNHAKSLRDNREFLVGKDESSKAALALLLASTAVFQYYENRLGEAHELQREALVFRKHFYTSDQPLYRMAAFRLSLLHNVQKQYRAAEDLASDLLEQLKLRGDSGDPLLSLTMHQLMHAYLEQGDQRQEQAKKLYDEIEQRTNKARYKESDDEYVEWWRHFDFANIAFRVEEWATFDEICEESSAGRGKMTQESLAMKTLYCASLQKRGRWQDADVKRRQNWSLFIRFYGAGAFDPLKAIKGISIMRGQPVLTGEVQWLFEKCRAEARKIQQRGTLPNLLSQCTQLIEHYNRIDGAENKVNKPREIDPLAKHAKKIGAAWTAKSNREDMKCLLSLDGGGVKTISSLFMLKQIMDELNRQRKTALLDEVKPYQVFDLIGGTSAGGIAAIMLGHLNMSVDECIEAFEAFAKTIFVHRVNLGKFWNMIHPQFDRKYLQNAVDTLLKDEEVSEYAMLNVENRPGCKVFVTTAIESPYQIRLLRSYGNLPQGEFNPTIAQAVQMTTAAPTVYKPFTHRGLSYIDGAVGANNPVRRVEQEAKKIWYPKEKDIKSRFQCVISLGTGRPKVINVGSNAGTYLFSMAEIALQTEGTAEEYYNEWDEEDREERYFRFQVQHGLTEIDVWEEKRIGEIKELTRIYLADPEQALWIKKSAQRLMPIGILNNKGR